jgi:hypothetical protein
MSKRKRVKKMNKLRNPVARYVNQVNKPSVEADKTKYKRKQKHKGRDHAAA